MKSSYLKLHTVEVFVYFSIWFSFTLSSIFKVFKISQSKEIITKGHAHGLFSPSKFWFTGVQFMDLSDYEWKIVIETFTNQFVFPHVLHFAVMRFSERFSEKNRFHASALFTMCFVYYTFDLTPLLVICCEMVLMLLCANITRSRICQWVLYLAIMFNSNTDTNVDWLYNHFSSYSLFYCYVAASGMGNLRTMSYCLDVCDETVDKKQKSFFAKLVDLFEFQFYFPLFLGGPIFTYKQFKVQKEMSTIARWNISLVKNLILQLLRYGVWWFVITFYLHFMYISIIMKNFSLLNQQSPLTLVSLACIHDLHFCLKYMVLYGLPSVLCMFDSLQVPGAPHCVIGCYQFQQMWRYFDKGLHRWLVRHIYVPCGGSNVTGVRRLVNIVLPFAFVWVWHGMFTPHLVWASINACGVLVEKLLPIITELVAKKLGFEKSTLSTHWRRRCSALLSTLLFLPLILSNLYFLVSDVKTASMIIIRVYTSDFVELIMIHLLLYCGAQVCMEFLPETKKR